MVIQRRIRGGEGGRDGGRGRENTDRDQGNTEGEGGREGGREGKWEEGGEIRRGGVEGACGTAAGL